MKKQKGSPMRYFLPTTNYPLPTTAAKATLLLFGSLLLSGCIRDDLADCLDPISLRLSYTLNAENTERFQTEVESIGVWVYNRDELLVYQETRQRAELEEGNLFSLPIQNGDYTAVIWGNLNEDHYDCQLDDKLQTMRVQLLTAGSNVTHTQSALFHGLSRFSVSGESIADTISLTKNTNDIHVVLEGVTPTRSLGDTGYSVRVTGSNGLYKYDNTKAVSEQLQYIPGYQLGSTSSRADFRVMRLFIGDDLRVIIRHEGEIVLYESLTALLLEAPHINTNEDLDRYDDYTLTFNMDDTGVFMLSSIRVADWEYVVEEKGI